MCVNGGGGCKPTKGWEGEVSFSDSWIDSIPKALSFLHCMAGPHTVSYTYTTHCLSPHTQVGFPPTLGSNAGHLKRLLFSRAAALLACVGSRRRSKQKSTALQIMVPRTTLALLGLAVACSHMTSPAMAFVPLVTRGPASHSLGRWQGRAAAGVGKAPPLAPWHPQPRHAVPALYVHQGSEPPPAAVVEETNAIMDIPAALINNNFPTPNSVSACIIGTCHAVGPVGGGQKVTPPRPILATTPCSRIHTHMRT